jgi:hypothetical protein
MGAESLAALDPHTSPEAHARGDALFVILTPVLQTTHIAPGMKCRGLKGHDYESPLPTFSQSDPHPPLRGTFSRREKGSIDFYSATQLIDNRFAIAIALP